MYNGTMSCSTYVGLAVFDIKPAQTARRHEDGGDKMDGGDGDNDIYLFVRLDGGCIILLVQL